MRISAMLDCDSRYPRLHKLTRQGRWLPLVRNFMILVSHSYLRPTKPSPIGRYAAWRSWRSIPKPLASSYAGETRW